jgi:phosphoglycerate dehydrogenase-like enzyme
VIAAVTGPAHAAISAAAPPGVEVRRLDPTAIDEQVLAGAEFLVMDWDEHGVLPFLAGLPDLRIVQILCAGSEWAEPHIPSWVTLCNARGARDIPTAEWVVAALLGAFSGLLESVRNGAWSDRRPTELAGARVVILGHGSIGEAAAVRLAAFGADVVGVARTARNGIRGVDELPSLLPDADAVVVLTPLTEQTRGMVDAAFLARMRDGALLVNGGRGAVVDTGALLAEVQSGRLRAVLDVTDPEPLPDDHPLWTAPGTLAITPHHAGDSAPADERSRELAGEQLVRYARGEPLLNVVLAAGR